MEKEGEYTNVRANGLRNGIDLNRPDLPSAVLSFFTTPSPELQIDILEDEIERIPDILINPAYEASFLVAPANSVPPKKRDEQTYQSNSFYPATIFSLVKISRYNRISVCRSLVCPIQHSPGKRELLIHRKLKFKVNFTNDIRTVQSFRGEIGSSILSEVINGQQSGSLAKKTGIYQREDRSIIITTNKFNSAALKLVAWHKMKGFTTKLVVRDNWTSQTVDAEVKLFFKSFESVSGYFTIIGDHNDVPPALTGSFNEFEFISDLTYGCFDGKDDFDPEIARGRISAGSDAAALKSVEKIITYEQNPPTLSRFYKNAIAASYQQNYEDNLTDYADRRFLQCTEDIRTYLNRSHGITSRRVYTASPKRPHYWSKNYADGSLIPDSIFNLAYNGSYQDIVNEINLGSFLLYHYDHGWEQGFGDPAFNTYHLPKLTNKGMPCMVISIDCLTGKFNDTIDCFAEKLISGETGAVGVIASTQTTYSGPNDILYYGIMDAIWPSSDFFKVINSMPSSTPKSITTHGEIFRMGDVLDQGLIRMDEAYPFWTDYHKKIYHYFGDPTTIIWTKEPQTISLKHQDTISITAKTFALTDINTAGGVASLYNVTKDDIIGKAPITAKTVSINVDRPISTTDSVVLTIFAHNFRTRIIPVKVKAGPSVKVNNKKYVAVQNQDINIATYSLSGRKLNISFDKSYLPGSYTVDQLHRIPAGSGYYIAKIKMDDDKKIHTVPLFK
jgi:hypothetical protein